jgi:lipooligosaccharide transport system permease protein
MNAPVQLDDVVLGEAVWSASKAFLSGSAVLLVASVLGLVASPLALWVLPVVFLSGLGFAGLGLIMTSLSPSYDFFMYYFTLAVTPMMLASGVFFPLEQLPAWLQSVSHALPLTHAVALVRPLMNDEIPTAATLHVAVLLGYAVVACYVALVLARRRLLK